MNIDPTKIQKHIDNIDAQTAAHLVSHVADAVVIMDQQGMVENVINTQTPGLNALQKLVGSYWIDHTAIDSKKKVAALLNPKDAEESHRWRQINILMADGSSLPLMMSTIQVYKDNKIIAVDAKVNIDDNALYRQPEIVELIGTFDTTLGKHIWESIVAEARIALHIRVLEGRNAHHVFEAQFKAVARALRDAVALDSRVSGVPSTKGVL